MNALTEKNENTWQLYTAKNQLSRIVEKAARIPQTITVRGKETVVILSCDEYRRLVKPKESFIEALCVPILDDEDEKLFARDTSMVERGTPIELFD
jgi:prevent-host-death family protein